jgi:elongation factor Ts
MAEITAAAVKALRDKTQLPMMDCKKALEESGGDEQAAIRHLREQGKKIMGARTDRATEEGRLAIYTSMQPGVGAMIELQCESAQVAGQDGFAQLANDLALQLATGPGAKTAEELLAQPSPSRKGITLQEQMDELANQIREVFRLTRLVRLDGPCGGYVHHDRKNGVLIEVTGGTPELAKDVAMHVTAKPPKVVKIEQLDPEDVARERDILMEAARKEGKPENILAKMVEGRMRNFYGEWVLEEQPFIKDESQTVGKYAQAGGMKIVRFVHWKLGKE